MTVNSEDSLDEYRTSIVKKKEQLMDMVKAFQKPSEEEPDQFKRVVSKTFRKYAIIMEDIFHKLEMFAILNFGLRDQNEMLKNIINQLAELRQNPKMQLDIQETFEKYNELYSKQMESFRRHQADLE